MISLEIINVTLMIIKLSFFINITVNKNLKNINIKFNISGGNELERSTDFNLIIQQNYLY